MKLAFFLPTIALFFCFASTAMSEFNERSPGGLSLGQNGMLLFQRRDENQTFVNEAGASPDVYAKTLAASIVDVKKLIRGLEEKFETAPTPSEVQQAIAPLLSTLVAIQDTLDNVNAAGLQKQVLALRSELKQQAEGLIARLQLCINDFPILKDLLLPGFTAPSPMSYTSLPSYVAPSIVGGRIPTYTAEPPSNELRLAIAAVAPPRPSGTYVKQTKNGNLKLQLNDQEEGVEIPLYGTSSLIEGEVQLSGKADNVNSVEVKVEGRLRIKEIAEGGHTSAKLCLDSQTLWTKNTDGDHCPATLPFSLSLPTTFTYEEDTYPLPPTYDVKLSGLPGFTATVDYSITVFVDKPHVVPNVVKNTLFGSRSDTTLTTPFTYHPRSRPAVPIPPTHDPKSPNLQDIKTTFYIPASRVFFSLASFMPYGPSTSSASTSTKRMTKIHLLRQSTVDVRNTEVLGTKTDIWRVDAIGIGSFQIAGDGPNWIAYSGEIPISDAVKVPAFTAAGLTVKDYIVLSCTPPEPQKAPFSELRSVAAVRLTTDPYTADGTGIGAGAVYPNGIGLTNGNGVHHDEKDDFGDEDVDVREPVEE
ncbi:hypothetical protein ONZ45_g4526 [Pleurotus djamor]|nr:hypothetical protein ONZ45_g4526 [Pleurotus djamor]